MERQEAEGTLVQEVAKSCSHGQPPPQYMVKKEDRPSGNSPLASDIPVIDLNHLSQAVEVEKLRVALQSWGLFQAVGHDMSASFLDELRDAAKMFFQLPMEIKQKYSKIKEGFAFKFEGYGVDHVVAEDQILNWNDRLFLLVQPEDERKLELWPENPRSFRDNLQKYTVGARKVVEQVLSSAAKLLKLDENYFVHQLDRADVHARFNYFPCCSRPDLVLGIRPHSDGSFLTIVLLDKEVEGLQVLRGSEWVKVPIIPHALVINMGNLMEVMSNGIFKSPVHRVVANTKERISLAMFYLLEKEKDLEPAEALVDNTRPRFYKKVKVKDFYDAYFRNASLNKNTLDWLKA